MSGHLAAGTFCHRSQNCSGACGWRKGAQPHPYPQLLPNLSVAERQEQPCTYWGLGVIGFIFFNSILIIFFPALDGGGKRVNEYLIKVSSFHLGPSLLLPSFSFEPWWQGWSTGSWPCILGTNLTQPLCPTGGPALPEAQGEGSPGMREALRSCRWLPAHS